MSFDIETLYNLLPTIYRIRDLEQIDNDPALRVLSHNVNTTSGPILLPLKALLKVVAEQVGVLEENLAQLYDDLFIETCAEWVIPYIGDLVSYHTPHNTSSQSMRSEVAHTIGYRKGKGTATLLQSLVQDVTGWNAYVVEFFSLIAATQSINLTRPENCLVDLRTGNGEPLARLNTPFDQLTHTVDIRNISAGRGRYNIPNIGIFIWRLNNYSLTNVPAVRAVSNEGQCYFFNPLGTNTPLFTRPTSDENVPRGPQSVAMPITRSRLAHFLSDYYGRDKSFVFTVNIDGNDRDILPDRHIPSDRLQELIAIGDAVQKQLDELGKVLATSEETLTPARMRQLLTRSSDLNDGLNELYKVARTTNSHEGQDLTVFEHLLTTSNEFGRGLTRLATTKDILIQRLLFEPLMSTWSKLHTLVQKVHVDPQSLNDFFTVADLSRWENLPEDKIAIDPETGRFAFPKNIAPLLARMNITSRERIFKRVRSTFCYGFSADMGGGEYHRASSFADSPRSVQPVVASLKPLQDALNSLKPQEAIALPESAEGGVDVVEIVNSGRIEGFLSIEAAANQRIELRATDFRRPLLVLESQKKPSELLITGEEGGQVTLNGLVISHGTVRVTGKLERVTLQHCTLIPGLTLSEQNRPLEPQDVSLVVESPYTLIKIDHCIVGSLRVKENTQVHISHSIVDATSQEHIAYAGYVHGSKQSIPEHKHFGGTLSIENSTVIGHVHALAMEKASNTIFLSPVVVQKRQEGCIRYCHVPPHSHTPRQYQCVSIKENQEIPAFTSLRYGEPGYCQLLQRCPVKARTDDTRPDQSEAELFEQSIRQGADDEAELGAFHDLFQPQRETNLQLRLTEYLSFTLEPGILYMT